MFSEVQSTRESHINYSERHSILIFLRLIVYNPLQITLSVIKNIHMSNITHFIRTLSISISFQNFRQTFHSVRIAFHARDFFLHFFFFFFFFSLSPFVSVSEVEKSPCYKCYPLSRNAMEYINYQSFGIILCLYLRS